VPLFVAVLWIRRPETAERAVHERTVECGGKRWNPLDATLVARPVGHGVARIPDLGAARDASTN